MKSDQQVFTITEVGQIGDALRRVWESVKEEFNTGMFKLVKQDLDFIVEASLEGNHLESHGHGSSELIARFRELSYDKQQEFAAAALRMYA